MSLMDNAVWCPVVCPYCGRGNDYATGMNPEVPTPIPGAYTICAGCLGWAEFSESLELKALSTEEQQSMYDDYEGMMAFLLGFYAHRRKLLRELEAK